MLDNCSKAADLIREFPDTKIIDVQDNTINIETNVTLEKIAELNALLVNSKIKVVGFYEQKTDLEDIFMKISTEQ